MDLFLREMYVEQPPGSQNHKYWNHVFKLKKSLYSLKKGLGLSIID